MTGRGDGRTAGSSSGTRQQSWARAVWAARASPSWRKELQMPGLGLSYYRLWGPNPPDILQKCGQLDAPRWRKELHQVPGLSSVQLMSELIFFGMCIWWQTSGLFDNSYPLTFFLLDVRNFKFLHMRDVISEICPQLYRLWHFAQEWNIDLYSTFHLLKGHLRYLAFIEGKARHPKVGLSTQEMLRSAPWLLPLCGIHTWRAVFPHFSWRLASICLLYTPIPCTLHIQPIWLQTCTFSRTPF